MPEIWLNYGMTDVVLDIKAENLEQKIDTSGKTLSDSEIESKLESLDLSKPMELVVLNTSESVKKTLNVLFAKCDEKSIRRPSILADRKIINIVKNYFPEQNNISEFVAIENPNSNLVFVGEMEFDGMFGYETISTRLLKKFGTELMLSAYEKRKGDLPSPGQDVESFQIAKKFSKKFDLSVGHPSSTSSLSKAFGMYATKDIGNHKTMIISTGKDSSNFTLGKSLASIWNCSEAIKNDGIALLIAECKHGIGSDAIQQFIDGRLSVSRLKNPSQYINGMEDLLYLTEIQKKFQVGLLSILPDFYIKKLNIKPFNGIKQMMDFILKTQGQKQKIEIISDSARAILR
ncbi:MAG: transcriptional regulator [Thaumarchaeota archaeon]|nr:MAG: transcriptional regulator [Nitrososphaerota archaeon]